MIYLSILIMFGINIATLFVFNNLLNKSHKDYWDLASIFDNLEFDYHVLNNSHVNLAIDHKYTVEQNNEMYKALMIAGKQLDKQAKIIEEQTNLINYYKNKDDENTLRLAQRN